MVEQADIILEARGLRKVFNTGGEGLEVLKGVDLAVRAGELVAVMGESGVGKSTLLHLLGTLDLPTAGQLRIAGIDVLNLEDQALSRFRNRHIGFVFQFHYLLPEFTALENVLLPTRVAGVDRRKEALELMDSVGLADRLHHRPGALSGGECQRVAMVRALVNEPLVVLADEPSGNLDETTSESLHQLLAGLARERGQAFVVMTHDRKLAQSMDRQGRIEAGVLQMEDDAI
ncbi:MAG: ABC transporter ATP-binding protein [Gemmatimonadetes bacterium]|nr:ABC transporter ATP-binding protein [Gemmatimonadota bacterium]MYC73528.1 ABC transporter ATP-binding protein [Gemmatimonadota bacterium]